MGTVQNGRIGRKAVRGVRGPGHRGRRARVSGDVRARCASPSLEVPGHIIDRLGEPVDGSRQWVITSEWETPEHFFAWQQGEDHRDWWLRCAQWVDHDPVAALPGRQGDRGEKS